MNLKELMELASGELRSVPNLGSWRNELRRTIDQMNRALCSDMLRPWPWMVHREHPLVVYPDLELELGAGGVVRKLGWGDRTFDVPIGNLEGYMYPSNNKAEWADHHMALARGAVVELADRTLDTMLSTVSGNWGEAPFTIEMSYPTNGVFPSSANVTIQLDPRANIPDLTGEEGSIAIRFPRILLPPDCMSVIAVRNERGQVLRALTPAESAMGEIDRNRTGTPCYLLEDSGAPNRRQSGLWPTGLLPGRANHTPYLWQRETWPMRETISLSTGTSEEATHVRPSTKHKVFLAWFYAGRFGSPSNVATITTGSGEPKITVSGFVQPPTSGSEFEYGRRLSVWMAEGNASDEYGAFYFKGFITDPDADEYDIVTDNGPTDDQQLRPPRWDEQYFGALPKYIRIYPRPAEMLRYTIDYRRFPRALIEDTDVPEIDGPHDILAWLAAAHIIGQRGGDPSRCLYLVQQEERKLMARAGFNDRYQVRFGQVGALEDARRGLSYFLDADTAASLYTG